MRLRIIMSLDVGEVRWPSNNDPKRVGFNEWR